MTIYYDIYVNKTGGHTPHNTLGSVKVIDEVDDELITVWCNKKLGPKISLNGKNLIEMWRFMIVDEINDDRLITTIKRKSS